MHSPPLPRCLFSLRSITRPLLTLKKNTTSRSPRSVPPVQIPSWKTISCGSDPRFGTCGFGTDSSLFGTDSGQIRDSWIRDRFGFIRDRFGTDSGLVDSGQIRDSLLSIKSPWMSTGGDQSFLHQMVPLVMIGALQSLVSPCGQIFGTEARPHIFNKRWRTVPATPSDASYDWEIRRQTTMPGSPTVLRVFASNGLEYSRTARCPAFLSNYVSLDSPPVEGVDEVFRDNTIYFVDDTTCLMQQTWFLAARQALEHGPYFLNLDFPVLKSYRVDI
jgi:hypothetical protein